MKNTSSIRKILIVLLVSILTLAFGGLFACQTDTDEYSIETDKTEIVFYYQEEINFESYFENTYLKITKEDGEEYLIPFEKYMFTDEIDTSSVGEKTLELSYNEKTITLTYYVKYKVDFLVDGEIFESQFVLDVSQLDLTKIPTKTGFTFIEWSNVPTEINGNVQISASFSQDVVVPNLQPLSAVYGDKLASLTLPSNNFGYWKFVKDVNELVGDAGERQEEVQFVLLSEQVYKTDFVKINVSKKQLQFNINNTFFEYDGTNKIPSYTFSGVENSAVNVTPVPKQKEAINVGVYGYDFIIEDDNYFGECSVEFEITKKPIKIEISNEEITYGDTIPNFTVNVFNADGSVLDSSLISKLNLSTNTPINPQAGEHEIDLIEKNYDNFNLTDIKKGKLTVNKATHNVNVSVKEEKAVYGTILTNEDLISTNIDIGSWALKDGNVQILTANTFTAEVIFTPEDTKNYNTIEKEITFNVAKKPVQITLTNNEFTYDGEEKTVLFSVVGVLDNDFNVAGNIVKTNAGSYDINLVLTSEKYFAEDLKTKLIINKANKAEFSVVQSNLEETTYNEQSANKLQHILLPNGYSWKNAEQSLLIGENNYQVVYTPEDTNNYNVENAELKLKVNKAQGEIIVNMAENGEYTFNSTYQYNFSASVNNNEQKYSLSQVILYNGEQVDAIKDSGYYVITYTLEETAHYLGKTLEVIVKVLQVQNQDKVVESINATYLDTLEKFIELLPNSLYGEWTWQNSLTTKVGNVGERTFNAVFTPYTNYAINYASRVVEVKFNVGKFSVSAPTISETEKTFVYNASIQKPIILENELYKIKYDDSVNVGTYNVVISLKDSSNYKWKDGDSEDITYTYEITKASVEIPTISEESFVYNGATQKPTITDSPLYTFTNNGGVMVGTYKVTISLVDSSNYVWSNETIEDITYTYEITKASVEIPTISEESFIYNGATQKPTILENDLYTIVNNGGVNVGTYNVIISLVDSSNYKWKDGDSEDITYTYKIEKATNIFTLNPSLSKTTWVYGEEKGAISIGTAKFGDIIVVKYYDKDNNELVSMPENAGEYKVVFSVEETHNYTGLEKEIIFTISKASVEIPTISEESFVYNGLTQKPTILENDLYTIVNEGGVNVGTYKVVISLKDSSNYKWQGADSEDITYTYEITKASVEIPTISEESFVYNGAIQKPTITDNPLYTITNNGGVNVGTYNVIISLVDSSNYVWSNETIEDMTYTYEITKASVEIPTISEESFVYNASTQKPTILENDLYTIVNNGGVNVGTYEAVISLKDSSNYKWKDGDSEDITYTYEITKASVEIPTISEESFVYNGATQKPTITDNPLYTITNNGGVNVGTYNVIISLVDSSNYVWSNETIENITYSYEIIKSVVEVPNNSFATYTGEKLTADIKDTSLYQVIENEGGIEVGEYLIKVKLLDSKNYRWATTESEVVNVKFVIQKNGENGWIIEPNISGWIYGEVKNQPKYESKLGEVIVNYVGLNGTIYESKELPTMVGEYKAIFTVVGTENYMGLEKEIIFTISKASVEIPTISENTFVYNGATQKPTITDSPLYTITNNGGINVGTYKLTISLVDTFNYVWSNETIEDITYTYEITKASVEIPTISEESFVYNGAIQKPTILENERYEIKYNDSVNVGTYEVVISLKDSSNYKWQGADIEDLTYAYEITKASVEIPTISEESFVYNGAIQKPTILENELYEIKCDDSVNVGTYNVIISLVDSSNYVWSNETIEDITCSYEIIKAEVEIPTISEESFVYNASTQKPTITDNPLYTITNNGGVNVGTYEVIISLIDSSNYKWKDGDNEDITYTYEIIKAEVEIPTISENTFVYNASTQKPTILENDLYAIVNEGGINVGTYKLTISLVDTFNYVWSNETIENITYTYEIIKASVEIPTISEESFVYNASTQKPTILENDLYTIVNEGGVNVGTYEVIISLADSSNYKWKDGDSEDITYTYEITKASVEIPTISEESFIYNGATQKPTILENDLYAIVNEGGVNVGTYNATISLKDSSNYKWQDGDSEDITYTYKIEIATNIFTLNPSLSKTTWVYGEEKGAISIGTAKFGEVSLVYVDSENNKYNEMPTNAGEYKAVFSVVGTENYSALETQISFVIEKASVNLPNAPQNKSYTGNKLLADVVENNLYTIVNNGGTDVGEYEVIYTLKNDSNYKWKDNKGGATRTYVFVISKATNSWVTEPNLSKDTWGYGEESGILNVGSAIFGGTPSVIFIDQNNKEYKEAPTNAGTYRAVISVAETKNYTSLTTTINFTINKVTLTITAPQFVDTVFYENNVNLYNESNFVVMPTVNKNVLGEFKYELALGQQIENGKVKVKVTFVPTDNVNYVVDSEVYATINVKTVATIGSVNYGSIESALLNAVTNDVVWVTAGDKNIVIASNCVVPTGVTLNVPHTANEMNANGTATLTDTTVNNINAITVVTIKENVTLTNNGTIQIAGELSGGGGGKPYAGHTAGKTAKIVLNSNAKINSVGGTIKLFGLIVESESSNGSQVIVDGGNLYIPFVVRDFRGGSYMTAVYSNGKATAFNEFELRNVTSLVIIKNSSNVYGYANLYAGSQHNATTVNLVSTTSSSIIHFSNSNGYLTSKYNVVGGYKGVDTWADGILDIDIFGGATADPMTLTVQSKKVSTEKVFFPISWRLNVGLYNGTYTMAYKYKIMPGGVLTVGEGANLTIGTLGVYSEQAYETYRSNIQSVPAPSYKANAGDGQFIIEKGGTVTVTTAIGGIVTNNGGTITNNGSTSVSCPEVKKLTSLSIFSSCTVYNIALTYTTN